MLSRRKVSRGLRKAGTKKLSAPFEIHFASDGRKGTDCQIDSDKSIVISAGPRICGQIGKSHRKKIRRLGASLG